MSLTREPKGHTGSLQYLAQTANTKVILLNGAPAENIFWQVAGKVVVGGRAFF